MNSKAIKRQLLAAIAMVLVAAVALGSSTYAWFVSNNQVTANISSISAQSNAAFLQIASNVNLSDADTKTSQTLTTNPTALYPATPVVASNAVSWQTAYAAASDKPDAQKVGGVAKYYDLTDTTGYLVTSTVYLTTNQGAFNSLTVDSFSASIATGDEADIVNAVGAYIEGEDGKWVLFERNAADDAWEMTNSSDSGMLCATTGSVIQDSTTDTNGYTVTITLYYDGDYSTIFTDNFTHLGAAKSTIAFSAVPVQQGTSGYTQGT